MDVFCGNSALKTKLSLLNLKRFPCIIVERVILLKGYIISNWVSVYPISHLPIDVLNEVLEIMSINMQYKKFLAVYFH